MDLKKYLHTEFETYPQLFREVVAFLSKDDVVKNVMSAYREHKGLILSEIDSKSGTRYVFENKDGITSGEPQKHPAIAYWQLMSKKELLSLSFMPPILKNDIYLSRTKRWLVLPESDALDVFSDWVSNMNWVKKVWSVHKKTNDYKLLSEEDAFYVEAIGVLIDTLRKQAVLMIGAIGGDIKSLSGTIKEKELLVAEERERYFDLFSNKLTSDFRNYFQKSMLPAG